MKVTHALLEALIAEDVKYVFMVPGGLIDPFLPAFTHIQKIKPIIAAHEAGATYMADGYARASGNFGACFCIGGPGATNTVTALSAAYSDQSPVLLMTGEVPTAWEGSQSFQDASVDGLNDLEVLRPVTGGELVINNKAVAIHHIKKIISKMLSQPTLPVHLVIPKDIQNSNISEKYTQLEPELRHPQFVDIQAAEKAQTILAKHPKVVILAGGGVEKSNAEAALLKFAETHNIPVATTLRAKGVFPEDHPLSLGVYGYGGTRHAIEAINSKDIEVLLVLGSALSQRDTMFWSKKFQPKRALIQVDIQKTSLSHNYKLALGIISDVNAFLDYLNKTATQIDANSATNRKTWLQEIKNVGPNLYDLKNCRSNKLPLHPAHVISEFRKAMPRNTLLLVDSGAHRAFTAQYWRAYAPREYLSATGIGPMGWAIPASIGAKLAQPDKPCAVVTGDGCMLMHGNEIQAAARYNLPIIYLVINNSALGNVYIRAVEDGKKAAELTELPTHDWVAYAKAFGVKGIKVTKPEELAPAFAKALKSKGPVLLDVICDKKYLTPVEAYRESQHEWIEEG